MAAVGGAGSGFVRAQDGHRAQRRHQPRAA